VFVSTLPLSLEIEKEKKEERGCSWRHLHPPLWSRPGRDEKEKGEEKEI